MDPQFMIHYSFICQKKMYNDDWTEDVMMKWTFNALCIYAILHSMAMGLTPLRLKVEPYVILHNLSIYKQ